MVFVLAKPPKSGGVPSMRLKLQEQTSFVFSEVRHRLADAFVVMDELLAAHGEEVVAGVHADLARGLAHPDRGRHGVSADTVLRALIVKTVFGLSYERLEFHLRDSLTAQHFCRTEGCPPSRSALQRAIKLLQPETLEAVNRLIIGKAVEDGVEDAGTVSLDSTAIDVKVRAPTDSGLLCDVVRGGTRLLNRAKQYAADIEFVNHSRLARRRHLAAHHARRKVARVPHYRRLLWAAKKVTNYLCTALERLVQVDGTEGLRRKITELLDLAGTIINQARRRVIHGESVPSAEKVVSIHQSDVDIIIKDNRRTHFGHKLFATAGESGLVLDIFVERGNPSDAANTFRCVSRVRQATERLPDEVAADGGFASRDNLERLKELGVSNVCFAKGRGLKVSEMVSDARTYRRLRNFRSRIEATFSWLKRSFGLECCDWVGFESFRSYCWAATIAHNLMVLARDGPDG
jgi:IS5 family transposase